MLTKLRQLFEKVFCYHCPECRGRMELYDYHCEIDKEVYKCTKCKKVWVPL